MTVHAADTIHPDFILQQVGVYPMAFAQSLKGSGGRDDGNFFEIVTDWRLDPPSIMRELYMAKLMRQVRAAVQQKFNFMEFWGWPEMRERDDGTRMVYSRLRFLRVTIIHQPRPN